MNDHTSPHEWSYFTNPDVSKRGVWPFETSNSTILTSLFEHILLWLHTFDNNVCVSFSLWTPEDQLEYHSNVTHSNPGRWGFSLRKWATLQGINISHLGKRKIFHHGDRFSPPEDRVSGGDPFHIGLFIACKWGLLFFSDNLPGFSKDC